MTAEATFKHDHGTVQFTAAAAFASGQLCTLPDGRVGVIAGLKAVESGDPATARTNGVHTVAKTSGVAMLAGQTAWFVPASNVVSYYAPGRIYAGIVTADATMAATTVTVDLNAVKRYEIDSDSGNWTQTAVGSAACAAVLPNTKKLSLIATNEAEKIAYLSTASIAIAAKPRMEGRFAIFDIGASANDYDIGFASGDHASDFETIAEFVAVHFDANDLSITAHSDDGTTDVAAVDSTLDAVDDTYFHMLIDCADKDDCKVYINGVRILDGTTGAATTLKLTAATGPLYAIAHCEKTSGTTTGELRVEYMRAWSNQG